MSRAVKSMMIDRIRQDLSDCREVIVLDASKLDGVSANLLRTSLKKKNIRLLGVKNAVAKSALRDFGLSGIEKALVGSSTLAFGGEDIVCLTKEIVSWAEKLKPLEIRGGAIGETSLDKNDVETLSKSPGKNELLSQIVTAILSPGGRVSAAVTSVGGRIAGQIKTLADRGA
jgi:large subunit ribosomal protein L10